MFQENWAVPELSLVWLLSALKNAGYEGKTSYSHKAATSVSITDKNALIPKMLVENFNYRFPNCKAYLLTNSEILITKKELYKQHILEYFSPNDDITLFRANSYDHSDLATDIFKRGTVYGIEDTSNTYDILEALTYKY